MRFFHCSQSSNGMYPIIFELLALRSRTKEIITWLTNKNKEALLEASLRPVLYNGCSEKELEDFSENVHGAALF